MRSNIDVPTLGAQLREISQGRLGARQDDEIGIAGERAAGRDHVERYIRFGGQGIEIVDSGDTAQHWYRELYGLVLRLLPGGMQRSRILRRQLRGRREVGHDPQARQIAAAGDDGKPAIEEPRVAAQLVDDIALEAPPLAFLEE